MIEKASSPTYERGENIHRAKVSHKIIRYKKGAKIGVLWYNKSMGKPPFDQGPE
jgi:hypothetical protein